MQRTKSSIKNLMFAFAGQFVGILISFVARLVFVKILSSEYLGINGLFTNILSILSLVELGVGPAMTFSLYKPLAENDISKLKSLMKLYRKMYIGIGSIILLIGIAITPILPYFIENMPNISQNINIIYILFVINSAISYFYVYKRSLIISDQKRYIATAYKYSFYFVLNVAQIVVLMITKNYILYLVTQIIFTFLENFFVSRKADKMYPFLKEKNIEKLPKTDTNVIKKNVFAMVAHKIGGVVVNSTDNLLISKFIGLTAVGIYSNYYLITNALNTVIAQVFSSIVASIGNLCVTEDEERKYTVFERIFFINFWIYGFSSICIYILFNHFISIWLGNEYLFEMFTVVIIVINFYLTGMRKTVLAFRDAMGLYWQDRYKPIAEVVVNIVVSVILAKYLGVAGVFIGTCLSTVTVCLWMEPYILYKYGLKKNIMLYFRKYLKYSILTIVSGFVTVAITNLIKEVTIISFIIKLIVCLIVPNLCFLLATYKTQELKYYKELLIGIIKKKILNKQKI